jgi:1-phosphofructokinase family hexose kinase
VEGETRTNIVVISEQRKGQSTLISDGLLVRKKDMVAFKKQYAAALKKADCVLIGGTLPKGIEAAFYTSLVQQARKAGLPVVFDASGPGLKAGLAGQPTVAKPNLDEISELVGGPVTTIKQAYEHGRRLQKRYGTALIITLGGDGALAVLDDRSYHIPTLKINAVSTAGAGDAVLAGLAAALATGQPMEEGLRLGFAAAAAVCLTPATADCRRKDVERLLPEVKLIPYMG